MGNGAGLEGLFDPARVNTLCTNQNPPDLPVDSRPHPLQIGLPAPLGLIVGVADVVSD